MSAGIQTRAPWSSHRDATGRTGSLPPARSCRARWPHRCPSAPSGSLAIHGDTFIVSCSNVDRLFSCYIKDLEASDLMSGDGVIIRGPNLYDGGKMRTITVHFVYYRK